MLKHAQNTVVPSKACHGLPHPCGLELFWAQTGFPPGFLCITQCAVCHLFRKSVPHTRWHSPHHCSLRHTAQVPVPAETAGQREHRCCWGVWATPSALLHQPASPPVQMSHLPQTLAPVRTNSPLLSLILCGFSIIVSCLKVCLLYWIRCLVSVELGHSRLYLPWALFTKY